MFCTVPVGATLPFNMQLFVATFLGLLLSLETKFLRSILYCQLL